ncbi:MAG: hypothetical protein KatS3mg050_0529 [Litorilinea sp.]|nr:MAG: hypothetical protein KatS3mg050_0529 [Litorilinea sp.]
MERRRGNRWLAAVLALLLIGLLSLFGLGHWPPGGWPVARPTSPTATPQPLLTPTASPASDSLPPAAPLPVEAGWKARPVATVVSRELVTTTHLATGDATILSVALSGDGQTVAFAARGDPGIGQSDNGYDHVYLHERASGRTRLLSAAPDGSPGNGWSGGPALSADGQVVAFYSWASNLVAGDTNAVQDLFVYDRRQGTLTRVLAARGVQPNDRSGDSSGQTPPALSGDGRYVAFQSRASNLVDGDGNGRVDVFVHDRRTGETTRVSVADDGRETNDDSGAPALSGDGRYVAFQSRATNLVSLGGAAAGEAPPGGHSQIYLHDRLNGTTVLISVTPAGLPGNGDSVRPGLSFDGRFLVFQSAASNLVDQDLNQSADIFVFDRESGEMQLISRSSAGIQGNRDSTAPAISPDGRYVAFLSQASNLVNGDSNGVADVFIHDLLTRHTARASVGVTGPSLGVEADGPSLGLPAIGAGGRLVAFVSTATNLVPGYGRGGAGLFFHQRQDLPTFVVRGRVVDTAQQPIAGATVRLGPHEAMTGDDGAFAFPHTMAGTYTAQVEKPGYGFQPPRQTVSVLVDTTLGDFVGVAQGGPPIPFLDLPLAYDGTVIGFLQALQDTDAGGYVDAWFDHAYPDYSKNGELLLWDGLRRSSQAYNPALGCFEGRCYDGHDGVDFPYRPPAGQPGRYVPLPIYPAAPGQVLAIQTACTGAGRWCNGGYGNEVWLDHGNGYFTRYAHLARVDVAVGMWVTPERSLGLMGNTGNSYGVHLHFGVYRDDGNGRWDGPAVDRPVDPFGWAGAAADPWAMERGAPASYWLWRYDPVRTFALLGSRGATVTDATGTIEVTVPPDALDGQVKLELAYGPATPAPPLPLRATGRSFRLAVLESLHQAESVQATSALLRAPVTVAVNLAGLDLRHLEPGQLALYQWTEGAGGWQRLPSQVDLANRTVTAQASRLGTFALLAPLRCPGDPLEPDDRFHGATEISPGGAGQLRLLDVADDEDWIRLEMAAGAWATAVVEPQHPALRPALTVFHVDGLTQLADAEAGAPGEPVRVSWQAPHDGTYFVRIRPAADSAVGCEVAYRLRLP